ncbi:MAG: Plug domain-containing protein [Brevinematales bacterium]
MPIFLFFLVKGEKSFSSKIKGSVTVVALVAVTLLFLLSIVMTVMVQTGFLQTQRSVQKTKTRWFLEGEVARWFNQWESGELPPSGKRRFGSSSFSGELVWEVNRTNWYLSGKAGKGISHSEIYLEGLTVPLWSTSVCWLYPVKLSLSAPWKIQGTMAIAPGSEIFTNTYTLIVEKEVIVGDRRGIGQFSPSYSIVFPELWRGKRDISFLWTLARYVVQDPWFISHEVGYPLREVVNPLHLEKIFLGRGKTQFFFPFRWQHRIGVYVRSDKSTQGTWHDFLYYRGLQKENVMEINEKNEISLLLSRDPYLREVAPVVELPQEAWDKLGEIRLDGKDISLISRDEVVSGFRMAGRYYFAESDFVYERGRKVLRIMSGEFFRRHVTDVAIANGVSREYTLPVVRGNVLVYVDGIRVLNYRRDQTRLVFDTPPPAGSRIQIFRGGEDFVLYKRPPSLDDAVFVDRVERCIVLDLDGLQNLPDNGVIYTILPVIIRGTARQPLAIVGEASIYLEDINPEGGEPIVVASRKGVWLLQENSFPKTIKNVVIVSPLAGLYTVGETFVPATIEGVAVFSAFGPVEGLAGFMEQVFRLVDIHQGDIPLLRQLPRPLFIRKIWRR